MEEIRTRQVWESMSPELKSALGQLAADNNGGQLTSEMQQVIQANETHDAVEGQGGTE